MYQIGDTIVYTSNGVCRIDDIREEAFGGTTRAYYVLQPRNGNLAVYVPTDNERLLGHMRPLSTPQRVQEVIHSILLEEAPVWIGDNHKRNVYFQSVLNEADIMELMRLTRAVRSRREELAAHGKRNLLADENINKRAERMLFGEIAEVVGISPDEVEAYISDSLEAVR